MTIDDHPRIAVDPAICGGRPTVAAAAGMTAGATEVEIVANFAYFGVEGIRVCS